MRDELERSGRALVFILVLLAGTLLLGLVALASPASASPSEHPLFINARYAVDDGIICTNLWSDTNCWSLTSGGLPGASVPTAINDVIIDTNVVGSAVNVPEIDVNIAAYARNIYYSAPGSNGGFIDVREDKTLSFQSLTVNAGTTFYFGLEARTSVQFSGSINGGEASPTGCLSATGACMFMSGGTNFIQYTGTGRALMSNFEMSAVTAIGETIYCSPGCTDDGGNTNVVFAAPPSTGGGGGTTPTAPPAPFPYLGLLIIILQVAIIMSAALLFSIYLLKVGGVTIRVLLWLIFLGGLIALAVLLWQ